MAQKRRRDAAAGVTLVWPGKDRKRGAGSVLPGDLRVVERFDPERLREDGGAQRQLPLGEAEPERAPVTSDWRNLLVFGDNGMAMEALAERVAGQIDLIYIDPPFATGLSYYSQAGRAGASLEHRAYRDTLQGGMAGYADTMFERLRLMRELLSDNGKIFVHCDWRASAVLRLLLDELFGTDCFRNEIIWRRAPNLGRQAASKQLGRVYDSIFVYTKNAGALFTGQVPRRRSLVALDTKGTPKGARWDDAREAYFTTAPRGDYTDKSIARLREEGRIYDSSAGKVYIKYFLTKGEDGRWYKDQPVDALWDDYDVRPLRHRPKAEAMGYDTQKPEGLLERILSWGTQPGDLVADFFCGSGTTMAVAQAMGRRWIGCDRQRTAIEITRRRLADKGASFEVCSVMRAERRRWAEDLAMVDADDREVDAAVVLEAFGAVDIDGRWAKKQTARVYVGPLQTAMTAKDVEAACREAGGGELVVLAWEWAAHDARALRMRVKSEIGVELVMFTVPLEVMRGGMATSKLQFVERPEIELEIVPDGSARQLAVRVTDVRCPAPSRWREDKSNKGNKDDKAKLSWSDYIDNWRLDHSGLPSEPFSATWQGIRAGEMPLQSAPHHYASVARVRVKVFTVFGDEVDRTIVIEC